jgi:hypothetical protein
MRDHTGLGLIPFDPGQILGPIATIYKTIEESKIAKSQSKLEQQKMKAQKEQDARDLAMSQAQQQVKPFEEKRKQQITALYAVGGAAALISLVFIIAAVRRGKSQPEPSAPRKGK